MQGDHAGRQQCDGRHEHDGDGVIAWQEKLGAELQRRDGGDECVPGGGKLVQHREEAEPDHRSREAM